MLVTICGGIRVGDRSLLEPGLFQRGRGNELQKKKCNNWPDTLAGSYLSPWQQRRMESFILKICKVPLTLLLLRGKFPQTLTHLMIGGGNRKQQLGTGKSLIQKTIRKFLEKKEKTVKLTEKEH